MISFYFPELPQTTLLQPQKVSHGIFQDEMADLQANADLGPLQNELQMAKLCAIATKLFTERHYTSFDKSLSRTVVIAGSEVSLAGITACFFICHSNDVMGLYLN